MPWPSPRTLTDTQGPRDFIGRKFATVYPETSDMLLLGWRSSIRAADWAADWAEVAGLDVVSPFVCAVDFFASDVPCVLGSPIGLGPVPVKSRTFVPSVFYLTDYKAERGRGHGGVHP